MELFYEKVHPWKSLIVFRKSYTIDGNTSVFNHPFSEFHFTYILFGICLFSCKATVLKSLFGMRVLLWICCIFSEHFFLRTHLEGWFWFTMVHEKKQKNKKQKQKKQRSIKGVWQRPKYALTFNVFDHFLGLALKGSSKFIAILRKQTCFSWKFVIGIISWKSLTVFTKKVPLEFFIGF